MFDLHRVTAYLDAPGPLVPYRDRHSSNADVLSGLTFFALLLGAFFFGLHLSFLWSSGTVGKLWNWWRSPGRRRAARLSGLAPARFAEVSPGAFVAVTGSVVGGGGHDPDRPTGHIIIEDGYGARLQIGHGNVIEHFRIGETVYAAGMVERHASAGGGPAPRSWNDYRSGSAIEVIVPTSDGFFVVERGTPQEIVARLAVPDNRPPIPLPGFGVLGAGLLAVGLWLLVR